MPRLWALMSLFMSASVISPGIDPWSMSGMDDVMLGIGSACPQAVSHLVMVSISGSCAFWIVAASCFTSVSAARESARAAIWIACW